MTRIHEFCQWFVSSYADKDFYHEASCRFRGVDTLLVVFQLKQMFIDGCKRIPIEQNCC